MHKRLIAIVRYTAAVVAIMAGSTFFSSTPAFAQLCAPTSTQSTCACPTSGAGATCFNGTLFRASSNDCGVDGRPCASNQNFDCNTLTCACNTAAYPCGGCTVASSTAGTACGAPTGGTYADQCSTCSCGAGTTFCSSGNKCVANRVCPSGSTWDVCTDTCVNPYVLISPGSQQAGFINVAGSITSGNDTYMANGKAIRVDGAGATTLNVGNWGTGATGINLNVFGALTPTQMCFGASCRTTWPGTADYDSTYVNVTGDTMTGTLNMTGASTNLTVAGNVGIGTASPGTRLEIQSATNGAYDGMSFYPANRTQTMYLGYAGIQTTTALNLGTSTASAIQFNINNAEKARIDTNGYVGIGTALPAAMLDVAGTAKMIGLQLTTGGGVGKTLVSDASGNATWQTLNNVSATGTTNYLPKYSGTSTLSNSQVFDNATNVGIGTALPAAKLDVAGTAKMTGFTLPTGAAASRVLTSDASGNGTWQVLAAAPVTSVSGSGAGISVGPTTGAVIVSNTGVTSLIAGTDISVSGATGAITVNNTSTLQTVTDRGAATTNGITINAPVIGVNATGAAEGMVAHGGNYGLLADGVNGIQGIANAANQYGVMGFAQSGGSGTGVYGNGSGNGVYGTGATGVYGNGSSTGVYGFSGSGTAGSFFSNTGTGLAVNSSGANAVSITAGGTYGIYESGAKNFLGGNLGVGISSPDTTLVVAGDGSGQARIGKGACGSANYTGLSLNGQTFSNSCANYNLLSSPTDPNLYINRPGGYSINFRENNADQLTILSGGATQVYGVMGVNGHTPWSGAGIYVAGSGYGVYSDSPNIGVFGYSSASTGGTGVNGITNGTSANAVIGEAWGTNSTGVYGKALYSGSNGVYGNGANIGVYGTGANYGLYGAGYYGVYGSGTYSFMGSGTLYNYGNAYAYGYYYSSDRRVKDDVTPFTDGLDTIEKIEPVNYTYNGLAMTQKGHHGVGAIAQDLAKVAPYAVTTRKAKLNPGDANETDVYAIDPSSLIFVSINAIKELDATTVKKDGAWGDGSGWKSCSADEECTCPDGMYVTKIKNAGTEIFCNKL